MASRGLPPGTVDDVDLEMCERMSRIRRRFGRKRRFVWLQWALYATILIAGAYTAAPGGGAAGGPDDPWLGGAEAAGSLERRLAAAQNATAAPPEDAESDGYPPDLLFSKPYGAAGNKGAIVLHLVGMLYMFAGLSIVCDEYFCAALEAMVEYWKIQPDVAGATFMAAGGSAPELAASVMGVFVADSDVGFGTIVGSAVFNVLFVIGLCAVCSTQVLQLTWWPLFRDCNYYIVGLGTLALFVTDGEVTGWEAAVLFLEYLGYVAIMRFNEAIRRRVGSLCAKGGTVSPEASEEEARRERKLRDTAKVVFMLKKEFWKAAISGDYSPAARAALEDFKTREAGAGKLKALANFVIQQTSQKREEVKETAHKLAAGPAHAGRAEKDGGDDAVAEEGEGEDGGGPFAWPDNLQGRVIFVLTAPIMLWLYLTIPDCTSAYWRAKSDKVFIATFCCSLVSIALFSYLMVWWATIAGQVFGVSDTVMGLTLLAAGTSIPDALSSVYMARNGEGDMAVSSSIGSNIFDILVGLPLPWMLKTVLLEPGSVASVHSPYVVVYVLLLLLMVACVVTSIMAAGWKMSRGLGVIMTILYCMFLAVAIYLEQDAPAAFKSANLF